MNPYTYIHSTLNQRKWNDHFLISASLAPASAQHAILEDGDNLSDHLPISMKFTGNLKPSPPAAGSPKKVPSLKWEKCSEEQKLKYNRNLATLLSNNPSKLPNCSNPHCRDDRCYAQIQAEYDSLINLVTQADRVLPRHKPGVQKSWWTEELTALRDQSIDIYRLWEAEGKPRSGDTNRERLRIKATYRKAVKSAQRAPKQSCWNRLHGAMASKNTTEFWKSWKYMYNKNKSHLHTVVNGFTEKTDIADSFKNHFTDVSKPNNQEKVDQLNNKFRTKYAEALAAHSNCNCHSQAITLENVLDAAFSLKKGKSADDHLVSAEHFFNAPLSLFDRLQHLFNSMMRHAFVPAQFQLGTIIPIVKDRQGDQGDLNNYRGVTIAPIFSKIFEHCLRIVFSEHLSTSQYQFGFKRKSSTSHAIFCLKESINYYTQRGSNVYCSFLDASKAFDRLVHAGLFLKLLERGVPLIFLNLIIAWYSDLQCRVRWGDTLSEWFVIKAGVRQGGILSPDFYSIYIDGLVDVLSRAGIGCHIRNIFLSILLYADDMALMAPSLKGLQKMLDLTENYCRQWDILLNPKKSKNMIFGQKHCLPNLQLDGNILEWVEKWTYLGITLRSHKNFECCIDEKVKSFYRSANAILRIEGRSNELVMLQLLETHCLSVLSYGIEIIHVSNPDTRRRLRVAYNSIFRQVFGYRLRDSVTDLQHTLKRPTWEELVERRTTKFLRTVSQNAFLCNFM